MVAISEGLEGLEGFILKNDRILKIGFLKIVIPKIK
jgi:hypothetical protein